MPDPVLMARQPIFNNEIAIVAYELLFRRSADIDAANIIDGDSATSELLINAFTHLNIDDVVGSKRAYVNFTRRLLSSPPPFDKSRFVIEVLEDVELDENLLSSLQRLSGSGYTIALDDFVMQPGAESLLKLADIVKIDVLDYSSEALRQCVEHLAPYGLKMLAEKVETHEMYNYCRDLGFELFQGYFLSRPQMIKGKSVPASKIAVMEVLALLQNPDITTKELETIISRDPVLSIRTMRMVNSAFHRPVSKIESLQRAITFLGLNQIKSLTSLLALTNLSDKPDALKHQTMIRARMCEELAAHFAPAERSSYFSTGLLSTLDAYFDQPLADVIGNMSLHEDLMRALLNFEGNHGRILRAVILHEKASWSEVDWDTLKTLNIDAQVMNTAYQDSITWADQAGVMSGKNH